MGKENRGKDGVPNAADGDLIMTERDVSDDGGVENTRDLTSEVRTDSPYILPDLPAINRPKLKDQWVAWDQRKRRRGKPLKVPINPHTGLGASVSNPKHWGSYDQAVARAIRDDLAGV